jgi:hypothetical protein
MPYYISPPPMNPLSRLLAGVLGVLVLVGAFFFGLFVLALVAGVGLIAWLAFSLRVWWLRKKMGGIRPGPAAGGGQDQTEGRGDANGKIIDAEYTVVSRRDED